MKYILSIPVVLVFLIFGINCSSNQDVHKIKISGKIENLPNGKIFLVHVPDRKNIIDSAIINGGRFEINTSAKKEELFSDVTLIAVDQTDTLREFSYPTNKLYNGRPNLFDHFLLENNVLVNGKMKDFRKKGFSFPGKLKIVELDQAVKGKQTWVLNNIVLKFPRSESDLIYWNEFKHNVLKYSYSFYLLKNISENLNLLSNQQLKEILPLFNEDIKQTPLWQNLNKISVNISNSKYAIKKFNYLNDKNKNQPLLDTTDGHINVIIFWASWCVPCLNEIPSLKKFHSLSRMNDKITLISISLDNNKESWQKSVDSLKLPWSQLIVSDNDKQRELLNYFKINATIPAIIVTDNKGNAKEKLVGYDPKENLVDKLIKITSN